VKSDPNAASKHAAARAALAFVEAGTVLGVGSGSTATAFVSELAARGPRIAAAVASSRATEGLLLQAGIRVVRLEDAGDVPVYIDGADEVDPELRLLKGRGGAHAREKLVAGASRLFVCIVDETKLVPRLGAGPVAVEVDPPLRSRATSALAALGGAPVLREGFVTDGGGEILDVTGLDLTDPIAAEVRIEALPGVVACGIFARRRADVVLVGTLDGRVRELRR
jgi:ribose 5-phosphate isomerase A